MPELPDFITQHIDPLSGDDNSDDIDAGVAGFVSGPPELNIPQPNLPRGEAAGEVIEAPISRNAPCPCGSGLKYKHCHGQIA
jgi:preprotein translocase subunit SecA